MVFGDDERSGFTVDEVEEASVEETFVNSCLT